MNNGYFFPKIQNSGNIYIESSEVAGEEYCLVLEAVDREGRTAQVPVAINTGSYRFP